MPKASAKKSPQINPVRLLVAKREGRTHTADEIRGLIDGFVTGQVADYQMSAWLMAALLNGMTDKETVALTEAMLHSGDVLRLKSVKPRKVDKHSTGGVGDKISICLAPLVAACGVAVPMISGRGLGHTGGTLDKLEAIPGYDVSLDEKTFERVVRTVGTAMIGQTSRLAPADKRIYALRDVTGTVESIPLIVASILSKKLAEGIDGLVLDVKVGRGAFMKDLKSGRNLARALVRVGKGAGKQVTALLTDMESPIGLTIGNANETREALEVLHNAGPDDTVDLTLELGAEMLMIGRVAKTKKQALAKLQAARADGSALETFAKMVKAQGGDTRVVFDPSLLPRAKQRVAVPAATSGYVASIDSMELGLVGVALGAGRTRADQAVDHAVGIELPQSIGAKVSKGDPLAFIDVHKKAAATPHVKRVQAAFKLTRTQPKSKSRILERLTK